MNEKVTNENYIPTVIDLFSGAGGTGLGFRDAGFRILSAVEKDRNAAETYRKNLGVNVTQTDIHDLNPNEFRSVLGLQQGELDVLVGCPPCQGFSRLRNRNKGAGSEDDRNDLVLTYLMFVSEFRPKYALFENVPGLLQTKNGREFYEKLKIGLKKLRYDFMEKEMDAADYGTPQHRRRVILIAGKVGTLAEFPAPTHGHPDTLEVGAGLLAPWRTVRDAIQRFPPVASGENGEQDGTYPNHIAARTGTTVLEFIRQVPVDGGSRTDVAREYWLECHKNNDGFKDVYGRLQWDKPSNTITSGCTNPSKGRFVHPVQDRALTYREAAALQGFPDDYIFFGTRVSEQIGNAVPPPLARALAQSLKCAIFETVKVKDSTCF